SAPGSGAARCRSPPCPHREAPPPPPWRPDRDRRVRAFRPARESSVASDLLDSAARSGPAVQNAKIHRRRQELPDAELERRLPRSLEPRILADIVEQAHALDPRKRPGEQPRQFAVAEARVRAGLAPPLPGDPPAPVQEIPLHLLPRRRAAAEVAHEPRTIR